jgi:hypothetical protein
MELLGSLPLEDGSSWASRAAPFQLQDARAILDGAAQFFYLTRARGGSKTSDLAALCLVEMMRRPDGRLYALASDKDQGGILVDALTGFIARSPALREHFKLGTWQVSCPRTGSVLQVLAADAPGTWGLRPTFVVVDEFASWMQVRAARQLWEAVSTAVPKVPGCRLVILTTAGDPAHWAASVLERARNDPAWYVHEVEGPPPWMDEEALATQERLHLPAVFRRLFHNEWTAPEDRLASIEDVRACVTLDGPLEPRSGRRYVCGLDLGLRGDRTVAAIAHQQDGTVVLDRMQVWSGSRENEVQLSVVEDFLMEVGRQFSPAFVFDPWQAVSLRQRLQSRGHRITDYTFTPQSVGRLAVTMYNLIREHRLAIPDDPDLIDELSNVRLRETSPGIFRVDHDAGQHDDRVVSLALAAQRLLERTTHDTVLDAGAFSLANVGLRRGRGTGWHI